MDKIKLLNDWPGVPAGTILEQDEAGNFCDPQSSFWVSAEMVKEKTDWFEPVKE